MMSDSLCNSVVALRIRKNKKERLLDILDECILSHLNTANITVHEYLLLSFITSWNNM